MIESISLRSESFNLNLHHTTLNIFHDGSNIIGHGDIGQINSFNPLIQGLEISYYSCFNNSLNQLYIFFKMKKISIKIKDLENLSSMFLLKENRTFIIKSFVEIEKLRLEFVCDEKKEFAFYVEKISGGNDFLFLKKVSLSALNDEKSPKTIHKKLSIGENIHLNFKPHIRLIMNVLRIDLNEFECLNHFILSLSEKIAKSLPKKPVKNGKDDPLLDKKNCNEGSTTNEIIFKDGYLTNVSFLIDEEESLRFTIKKLKLFHYNLKDKDRLHDTIIVRDLGLIISSSKDQSWERALDLNFSQFKIKMGTLTVFKVEKNFNFQDMRILHKKDVNEYCLEGNVTNMSLDVKLKFFDFLKSFRQSAIFLMKIHGDDETPLYFQRVYLKPINVSLTIDFSQVKTMKMNNFVKLASPLRFKNLDISLPGVEMFGNHSIHSLFQKLIDKWSQNVLSIEQVQFIVKDSFPKRFFALMNEEIVECIVISSKKVMTEYSDISSKNLVELYNVNQQSKNEEILRKEKPRTVFGFISKYSKEKMTVLPLFISEKKK